MLTHYKGVLCLLTAAVVAHRVLIPGQDVERAVADALVSKAGLYLEYRVTSLEINCWTLMMSSIKQCVYIVRGQLLGTYPKLP